MQKLKRILKFIIRLHTNIDIKATFILKSTLLYLSIKYPSLHFVELVS
jgi:hypothetical protein